MNGEVLGIYVSAQRSKCLMCIVDVSRLRFDGDVFWWSNFHSCFSFLCFSVKLVSRWQVEIIKSGFWDKLPLFYHFCVVCQCHQCKIVIYLFYSFTNDLLPLIYTIWTL